jgi:hypothetical protein
MVPKITKQSLGPKGDVDVSDALCIRFDDERGSSINVTWSDMAEGWIEVSGGYCLIEIRPIAENAIRIRVRER